MNEREAGASIEMGLEFRVGGKPLSTTCTTLDMAAGSQSVKCNQVVGPELSVETECLLDPANRIWRRSDRLVNSGDQSVDIENPKLKFHLAGSCSAVVVQESTWCREAQRRELSTASGEIVIGSKGRTCNGYVPHFTVLSDNSGCVFDLLPSGDWRAKFTKCSDGRGLDIELDRFEDEMVVTLAPGESFDLSFDCLVHHVDEYDYDEAGHRVQLYALDHFDRRRHSLLPVVYNTWFDRFFRISWESLETQLDAAAKVGCEVFVVDAGWFGTSTDDWFAAVGNWSENPDVFSERSLLEYADLVRSRGLDFGIWMEPQRMHVDIPMRREHPDWFIAGDIEGFCYPDLSNPKAHEWVLSEMVRVVGTYGVKWLKIDDNFDFSRDPDRLGHMNRVKAWYGILDEVSRRFPDLVIEGCESGGLGSDLLSISHFDTHFLSDTVDPIDTLRIGMSSLCRLAPRMTYKWVVLYPTGNGWTPYGNHGRDTGDLVLCPSVATSAKVSSYYLDFAMRAVMTGVIGISGNIAGLGDNLLGKLAKHIEFYKKHREFIQHSVGIPLTPVEPIEKRYGTVAIQLSDSEFRKSMVFVFNMGDKDCTLHVKLRQLDPEGSYRVLDEGNAVLQDGVQGLHLLDGLDVACEAGRSRVIFVEKVRGKNG